jgi:hypothetical protein
VLLTIGELTILVRRQNFSKTTGSAIMTDQEKYIKQFWRKYEILNEIALEARPSLNDFVSFLEVAYSTWLRSPNIAAQVEADIQHHVALQRRFFQLREREHDALRADAS